MPDQCPADLPDSRAAEIVRGTMRLLAGLGFHGVTEMTLANNRRADIAAVGPAGEIWIIEVKSSVADFRTDSKWPDYMSYCDRLFFAVGSDFPQELIPDETGLIVADAFGGAVIRDAPEDRVAAARRKAVTLRLARLASMRLMQAADTGWTVAPALLT
ncbi:MAG: MmcB family DNA repair protein [Alphaproteobacteria bacterium]|nr:MmcB family DNA repair protein [Alphaproteobacteria bacterium]|tara:strand:+ start:1988 stop:2461 length:474 start_codon:yes stop_codon:yes gene_type:complete